MKTKHTPGPWVPHKPEDGNGWFVVAFADDLTDVGSGDGGYSKEEATLMAAAPDLLEALQACAAKFAEYAEIHMIKGDKEKASKNLDMYRMCVNAIAKATGDVARPS